LIPLRGGRPPGRGDLIPAEKVPFISQETKGYNFLTVNRRLPTNRQFDRGCAHSYNSLGAFYQRMRARLGPKAAIVAMAHKIARIVYHLLTHRTPYRDLSAEEYDRRARERDLGNLRKRAAKLGLTLVESST
jgi:hypothetical protein